MFYKTKSRYIPQDILDLIYERNRLENKIEQINSELFKKMEDL